jgi:hypothetical protein
MGIEVLRDSDAPWTTVYFSLLDVLQADETLQAVGVTWNVMEGDRFSAEEPTDAQLPWVRVWPPPLLAEEMAINEFEVACPVRFEVVTATLDYRDHGNLWGALFAAVVRQKTYQGQALDLFFNALGSYNFVIRGQDPPAPYPAPKGYNLRSTGAITFRLITDA